MRKNMKKATALLIAAAMAAGLSACSSGGGGETKAPSGTQAADSGILEYIIKYLIKYLAYNKNSIMFAII